MASGRSGCRRSLFQLCIAAGLHLRRISEADCSRVLLVSASSVPGVRIRRDLRCDLLSDPGSVARPHTAPPRAPPLLAVFGAAFASLALLSHHLWHLYLVFIVLGVVGN